VKSGRLDAIVLRTNTTSGKSATMDIGIEVYATFLRVKWRKKSLISTRILRSKKSGEEIDGCVWPKRCVILRANHYIW